MPDNQDYQGAQDQGTTAADYNSRDFHIRQRIAEIRTGIPCKIIKAPYDKSGNPITPGSLSPIGFVDVQPMVNQIDGLGNATPHGVVYRVSYYRYQGANGAVISDPVVNDIGHMAVADRDTTSVRATSAVANPGSRRTHDIADGTYFGCSQSAAPTQCLAFTATGMTISDKNGNVIALASGGITVTVASGKTITLNAPAGHITMTAATNQITANGVVLG